MGKQFLGHLPVCFPVYENWFQHIALLSVLLSICVRWHQVTLNKLELEYTGRGLISQALKHKPNVKHRT